MRTTVPNAVVHVSEVELSSDTGMGRVELHWREAFEKRGFEFIHIGPREVGALPHPAAFPFLAYRHFSRMRLTPSTFLVHEPAAAWFLRRGAPCVVESHGVERRVWESMLQGVEQVSWRTRLAFPLWRLRGSDRGLAQADKLLLINSEDRDFVAKRFNRKARDMMVFRNGVETAAALSEGARMTERRSDEFVVLFNGSWLPRKGIYSLVEAAQLLAARGIRLRYLLIGTGATEQSVLMDWPTPLHSSVSVVSHFNANEEFNLLSSASVFVLPSFAEGQPLSLLQAMAAGRACITTDAPSQTDVVKDRENGLLFKAGDSLTLANLIEECHRSPELRQALATRARLDLAERSWQRVAGEVVDFVFT